MNRLLGAVVLLLLAPLPAFADLTAFLGRANAPEARSSNGFAIGTGLLIVGFEFEYGSTEERLRTADPDLLEDAPSIKTYMFNGLLQTPVPIARMQFYGTLGGGVYRETLSIDPDNDGTNFGTNIGGGAKITLAGPLRVRLDYRVFSLRGTPRHSTVQRFYAGVNLKF
jgi:opacity protein-like surface antigen